jgi:penicillin-binding protein 2
VNPDQLAPQFKQALLETYTGMGEKQVSIDSSTWMTVTEGMAAATTTGTAAASHLAGIDFAGKTGTAQVVGGGDTHTKGGLKTPNAWFVGMVPRRNPEFAVVVLQEHGDWGAGSAKLAAQIVTAYVNKKRKQENNLLLQADKPSVPVEMGAVWSTPEPIDKSARKSYSKSSRPAEADARPGMTQITGLKGGRFLIASNQQPEESTLPLFPDRPRSPRPQNSLQADASVGFPARFRGVIH